MTTTIEHRYGQLRAATFGFVTDGDRGRDFRLARRHSSIVRSFRVLLPVLGVTIIGLYVATVMRAAGWGSNLPELALQKIIPENLTMHNPRYEGFTSDGGAYVVTAKTAAQNLKDLNLISLNSISGQLLDAAKARTDLTATRGTFDNKASRLELFEGIDVVSEGGMRAKLTTATVLTKEGMVVSKEPVTVEMTAGTIRANGMTMRQKTHEITFVHAVEAHFKATEKPPGQNTLSASSASQLFTASGAPIDVTASRLDINAQTKIAVFTGSVRAVQGDATLTTPELEISYESGTADAVAGTAAAQEKARVRQIIAKPPVVITRGSGERVTSQDAQFDAAAETAVLTGNVVMTSHPDRKISGDKAEIDQRADTVLMTGNVVAVQGRNELKGRRLFFDRKSGRTQLTVPGGGTGRIAARFYQGEGGGSGGASTTTAQTGEARNGIGIATFKTDPNAPIDIEADQLDVNEPAKAAVFRGDVHAVQGDFNIRTAELTAFYSGEAGVAVAVPDQAKRQPARVTKIEARRKVVVTSKGDQKATGDWADFYASQNKATIGGDVVLTRGQNVVRGTRLDIDMKTGQSVIQTSTEPVTTAPAASSSTHTDAPVAAGALARPNRPSAVFYPKQVKDALKARQNSATTPATQSSPGPASSSWEAETEPPADGSGN